MLSWPSAAPLASVQSVMSLACLIEETSAWVNSLLDALTVAERPSPRGAAENRGGPMGIGGSIFLLAVGAILAFAVNANFSGIDINVIGWILMAAGLVGLIITLWFWNSRRRTVVTRRSQQPVVGGTPYAAERAEYRETREDVPPPPPGY